MISNELAILLLSFMVGAANLIGMIGAPSYVLSLLNPNYVLFAVLVSGTSFFLFQRSIRLKHWKFSRFAGFVLLSYFIALASLAPPLYPEKIRAFAWMFISVFGIGLCRWIMSEITTLHLDPIRAKPYFSYLPISYEMGMLMALIGLKIPSHGLDPPQMIELASGLYLLILALLAVQFWPKKNREIRFTKKAEEPIDLPKELVKQLAYSIALVAFTIGAAVVCQEHLNRVVLKEELVSYEAIRNMMTNYRLVGSVSMILLGFATGNFIQRRHPSPILLLSLNSLALACIAIVCLVTQAFYAFIALEVVKRILEQTLYSPANNILYSFFVPQYRGKFRSLESFCYFNIPTLPLFILFLFTPKLGIYGQKTFILSLILVLLSCNLVALRRFRPRLIRCVGEFVKSGHKTASILAIQAFSFLRPRKFIEKMDEILGHAPKKLLRKNIILALGYSRQEPALDIIIREFSGGIEEIQRASLDALDISRTYRGAHFMTRILMNKADPVSPRIRMQAMKSIAKTGGKKSIPLILLGLQESDPKVVANTLEVLDRYRDKKLIPVFERYIDSQDPWVRAYALLALARFRKSRELYRRKVLETVQGQDEGRIAAALFIIGKLRDSHFREWLVRLEESPFRDSLQVKPTLAWALSKTRDTKRGFALFKELIIRAIENPDQRQDVRHYFTMLPRKTRLSLVEYMVRALENEQSFLRKASGEMKRSELDYHEEIESIFYLSGMPELSSPKIQGEGKERPHD